LESGLDIARKLRNNDQTKEIGIIFLTARSNIADRIAGLEFADAYHIKPIDYQELGAICIIFYNIDSSHFLLSFTWWLGSHKWIEINHWLA
jgi:CheY-like chemotaxis protein